MNLTTKYNVFQRVWVINGKKGAAVEREIQGLKTQYINDKQKTMYSFLKDRVDPNNRYYDYLQLVPKDPEDIADNYFWLSEDKCYASKEELLNNL